MPITRVQFDKEDQDDHSVTFKQTRSDNGETVDYTFTQSAEGAIEVSANGVCVLTLFRLRRDVGHLDLVATRRVEQSCCAVRACPG